ncbi:MAG TPA: efflux RND transporter periplasmic adaptor subunit [Anaeromyxobacteraceae bacterium]|nr:efflux RND transporter periplasmic adaptor subunit [Anaeromyxobacteraceae bacterium]
MRARSPCSALRGASLLAFTVALLAGCAKKEQAAPAAAPPEVPVVEVAQKDTPLTFELVAQLKGFEDVEIRARVSGFLKSVDYTEGGNVKKGQLLFTIDDEPYKAQVAQAQAAVARAESALAKAELDVKRSTPLAEKRAISQRELDNDLAQRRSATAVVAAAKAQLEQARLDLGYTRVFSPVNGLAGYAERKVGDLVGKDGPTKLTTVSTLDPIRATVNIREADYLRFAKARAAREGKGKGNVKDREPKLILADGSTYPATGKIVLVDRAVDPLTGSLRVDLAFPNPDRLLRPGFYGRIVADYDELKGALLVPQEAVTELQGSYLVAVVGEGDKIDVRKIETGPKVGGMWVVTSGLKPGERVVTAGSQRLRPGQVVKPVAPSPAEMKAAEGQPPGAPAGATAKASEGK